MVLCGLRDEVWSMLMVTGLDKIFTFRARHHDRAGPHPDRRGAISGGTSEATATCSSGGGEPLDTRVQRPVARLSESD